jgi:hypothetical protein
MTGYAFRKKSAQRVSPILCNFFKVYFVAVGPGEAITGGEVVRGGRQISFDVIANVRKIVRSTSSQRVSYEVTVRRMNCLPDPPEPEVSCKILR